MNIGFDGIWAVFNHTSRGNMSRNIINAIASIAPKNKYIIYSPISNENRHLTPLLANPNVSIRQPKHGYFKYLWRWGDGLGKDLHRHHIRIYHGLCGVLPFYKGGSHAHWVVSINDLDMYYNSKGMGFWKCLKEKIALRHSLKMAERIIVPSQSAATILTSRFKVDPDKIDVVPPCVDKNFSVPVHEDAKQALAKHHGIPERFILVMGPLDESKHLLDIVKTFKYINDKELGLVLMGKTTQYYRRAIRPYVNEHNLHDRVIHVKHIHSVDLPNIYQQALAVICPKLNSMYSLSMLESMKSGTPVIVLPNSIMAKEAGDAVLTATDSTPKAIAEAINTFISSPELQETLIQRGREMAERFSSENTANALIACYDKIED